MLFDTRISITNHCMSCTLQYVVLLFSCLQLFGLNSTLFVKTVTPCFVCLVHFWTCFFFFQTLSIPQSEVVFKFCFILLIFMQVSIFILRVTLYIFIIISPVFHLLGYYLLVPNMNNDVCLLFSFMHFYQLLALYSLKI